MKTDKAKKGALKIKISISKVAAKVMPKKKTAPKKAVAKAKSVKKVAKKRTSKMSY